MSDLPRFLLATVWLVASTSVARAKNYRVVLAPGAETSAAQVVTFNLPADVPRPAVLRDAEGRSVPLQAAGDGTASFLVATQRAGETRVFSLGAGQPTAAGVTVAHEPGRVGVAVGGAPALFFRTDKNEVPRADIDPKYKRAGYLHPLLTPAGAVVTGDYPSNHVHHHGIWSPWVKTSFQGRTPDFWNMQGGTGTVEFVAVERTWGGPVHGGFVSRQRLLDLSTRPAVAAIDETWVVTVYNLPGGAAPMRIVDLTITHACATADPLGLPQYHYGGLGLRGRDEWNGKDKLTVLTSDGETDRVKANARRMRWCYLGGAVAGGAMAGVAVLDHPGNFRAPQPVRVHPDMPYVSVTPSQLGDWAIEPGKPYVARYRFLALDGAPDRARLDACWHGFAAAAHVAVEAQ
jgi:hypothetical protein